MDTFLFQRLFCSTKKIQHNSLQKNSNFKNTLKYNFQITVLFNSWLLIQPFMCYILCVTFPIAYTLFEGSYHSFIYQYLMSSVRQALCRSPWDATLNKTHTVSHTYLRVSMLKSDKPGWEFRYYLLCDINDIHFLILTPWVSRHTVSFNKCWLRSW